MRMICDKLLAIVLLLSCKIPSHDGANVMMSHIPLLSLGQRDFLVWKNIRLKVRKKVR